jgi:hypothetical protein
VLYQAKQLPFYKVHKALIWDTIKSRVAKDKSALSS